MIINILILKAFETGCSYDFEVVMNGWMCLKPGQVTSIPDKGVIGFWTSHCLGLFSI